MNGRIRTKRNAEKESHDRYNTHVHICIRTIHENKKNQNLIQALRTVKMATGQRERVSCHREADVAAHLPLKVLEDTLNQPLLLCGGHFVPFFGDFRPRRSKIGREGVSVCF